MFWACAQLESNRERLALHCLELGGYSTYLPRIRERRRVNGRQVTVTPPLFPGYAFVLIELRWHAARWCPGVAKLVMGGDKPARVADKVIAELRERERGGFVQLPAPPQFHHGDRVRIARGIFAGQLAVFDGMRPHERVAVLLQLLGSERTVELAQSDVLKL
jgi:transcriptional antiterminator RfaH